MRLVVSGGSFNVRTAPCGANCINCYGYHFGVTPGDFAMNVDDTMACAFEGTDCNGFIQDFDATWSSDDSTVLSVDSVGTVTAQGAGSTIIRGQAVQTDIEVFQGQICSGGTPVCPTAQSQANTPGQAKANVQVTAASCDNNATIHSNAEPHLATLTVQVFHQTVSASGESITLEVGTGSSDPPSIGNNIIYTPADQAVSIPPSGSGVISKTVTVSNCGSGCAGTVMVRASLSHSSTNLQVTGNAVDTRLTIVSPEPSVQSFGLSALLSAWAEQADQRCR